MDRAEHRNGGISPFETFLRTGRRTLLRGEVQYKYNHNHDPTNGQFTFAPGGFRGGGGSFGGGGAAGSFGLPVAKSNTPKPKPKAILIPRSTPQPTRVTVKPAASNLAVRHVSKNGYDFEIDGLGRSTGIGGTLTRKSERRSRAAQRKAGGTDRLKTDDGGHYIALRFNGPRDQFNHFAQDANFNRGAYRVFEDRLHGLAKSGKTVRIRIEPKFVGTSLRPYMLHVMYRVDDEPNERDFLNKAKGT